MVARKIQLLSFVLLSVSLCVPIHANAEQMTDRAVSIVARALSEAIAARDAEAVSVLCALPINLDGEVVTTQEELLRHWQRVLAREDLRGLRLENLEVMTIAAAIEQHGQPPARLGDLPEDSVVAIIRWNRAQLIAVLANDGDRWTLIAVTD